MGKYGIDPSSAHKAPSYGERLRKSVQYVRRYSTKYAEPRRENNAISIRIFSSETTGPIFTKILYAVVALVALFNLAHTQCYPILFLNDRAISARKQFCPIFATKLVAMATSLEELEKWT